MNIFKQIQNLKVAVSNEWQKFGNRQDAKK
jgi:hypothetical protein